MDQNNHASPRIRIYTLGRFEVVLDGAPLRFILKAPRQPLALLKTLLCGGCAGVDEDALGSLLWPEMTPATAGQALLVTVQRLRGLLRLEGAVRRQAGRLRLDAGLCWVDAWEFEHATAHARDSSAALWALRWYRGAFLAELEHAAAGASRERLRRLYHAAVHRLGRSYERIGDTGSAIDLYLMAIEADGTCEETHRALMRCLASEGQNAAVGAAFQRCRTMLIRHHGTAPSPLTQQIADDACREPRREALAAAQPCQSFGA